MSHPSSDGKSIGVERLKNLTMNIGKVVVKNRELILTLDIRYPLSTSAARIKSFIEKKGYKVNVEKFIL